VAKRAAGSAAQPEAVNGGAVDSAAEWPAAAVVDGRVVPRRPEGMAAAGMEWEEVEVVLVVVELEAKGKGVVIRVTAVGAATVAVAVREVAVAAGMKEVKEVEAPERAGVKMAVDVVVEKRAVVVKGEENSAALVEVVKREVVEMAVEAPVAAMQAAAEVRAWFQSSNPSIRNPATSPKRHK